MKRADGHEALKRVADECRTAVGAIRALERILVEQPKYAEIHDISPEKLQGLSNGLERAYFIDLFARFEAVLRDYWKAYRRQRSRPKTRDLIDAAASRHLIPRGDSDAVQEIRDFRNALVHEENDSTIPYTISDASKCLNKFLSRLPLQW